jgi:hypothetical protein
MGNRFNMRILAKARISRHLGAKASRSGGTFQCRPTRRFRALPISGSGPADEGASSRR